GRCTPRLFVVAPRAAGGGHRRRSPPWSSASRPTRTATTTRATTTRRTVERVADRPSVGYRHEVTVGVDAELAFTRDRSGSAPTPPPAPVVRAVPPAPPPPAPVVRTGLDGGAFGPPPPGWGVWPKGGGHGPTARLGPRMVVGGTSRLAARLMRRWRSFSLKSL